MSGDADEEAATVQHSPLDGEESAQEAQEEPVNEFRSHHLPKEKDETGKVEVHPGYLCDHIKLEATIAQLRRELELANRAKESMVMRYANSEKEVIRKTKDAENIDKLLKAAVKENENLGRKNKMLSSERERLVLMVDSKVCEVQGLQKEVEKLKEENSAKDFKIKWAQTKLQSETEGHKGTLAKLEKTECDLAEALIEVQRMREGCREMIASCSPEPLNSAYEYIPSSNEVLDDNLVPSGCTSGDPRNTVSETFLKEIDTLKFKHKALIDENNDLSCKVQNLEEARLDQEQKISKLQEKNAEHLNMIATLRSEISVAESWKGQLEKERERILSIQSECTQLRQCNAELLADMAVCREKEAELLAYTQQVTGKNVQLQSEFSSLEAKSVLLTEENQRLLGIIEKLYVDTKKTDKIIDQEKCSWNEMREQLLASLEEKEASIQNIQHELDEARGEMLVMKKKHETTVKELRKELENLRRRCKETNGEGLSSRTSSSTSLNQGESQRSPDSSHLSNTESLSGLPMMPDQQAMVERIVKLQRALAKKQEKVEFLQEHGKQLLEGIQAKSKIIQAYAMNQEVGALTPDVLPHHKSELGKHGGLPKVMPGDDTMTLEISLEINRKLQAVLEDALMKNITLKESMRTLGSEICRLTEINKELTDKLQNLNPSGRVQSK